MLLLRLLLLLLLLMLMLMLMLHSWCFTVRRVVHDVLVCLVLLCGQTFIVHHNSS